MIVYLDSQTVSAEYVYWQMDELKIRGFLKATNHAMGAWLDAQWEAAESHASEIFDPDYHDAGLVAEVYEDRVGVWPPDYFWQLSAAVVKDAVALYEVFLEQLANVVLRRAGAQLATMNTEDSWKWAECEAFYRHYVGVDVRPPDVVAVLWIRNKLAHLRDELRTEAGHAEFAAHIEALGLGNPITPEEAALGLVEHRPYMAHGAHLTQLQTWRLLDIIADQVGVVARAAFPYLYRRQTNGYLEALGAGAPIGVKDLSVKQAQKLFIR